MVSKFLKRESWGFSLWRDGTQIGAAVGVPITAVSGAPLSKQQLTCLRKKGACALLEKRFSSASKGGTVRWKRDVIPAWG